MNEFQGRWVLRNGIRVPVPEPAPTKVLCWVCGGVAPTGLCRPCKDSMRERVHGSHAGFNQHQRRNEKPCGPCALAESEYQGKRYRRGQLSQVDLEWAEKNAVKSSWEMDTRTNRRASLTRI